MYAQVGDWLVVKAHAGSTRVRKAAITKVSADGAPPYTVRWLDSDRESLVFPGVDAVVVSSGRQLEEDRVQLERTVQVQRQISAAHHRGDG